MITPAHRAPDCGQGHLRAFDVKPAVAFDAGLNERAGAPVGKDIPDVQPVLFAHLADDAVAAGRQHEKIPDWEREAHRAGRRLVDNARAGKEASALAHALGGAALVICVEVEKAVHGLPPDCGYSAGCRASWRRCASGRKSFAVTRRFVIAAMRAASPSEGTCKPLRNRLTVARETPNSLASSSSEIRRLAIHSSSFMLKMYTGCKVHGKHNLHVTAWTQCAAIA